MTATYDLIASNVLTSSVTSVTFSSIPSTYRDLVAVVSATANTNANFNVTFNSDTGINYRYIRLQGNGSTASSQSNMTHNAIFEQSIDTTADQYIMQIMDYSVTDKHKIVLSRHNRPTAALWGIASRWANTSAINTIQFAVPGGNTFSSGSTFYLYGIVS